MCQLLERVLSSFGLIPGELRTMHGLGMFISSAIDGKLF